jgi:hypothetical protein
MVREIALIIAAVLVPVVALSQLRPDEITQAPDPDAEIRELLRDALEIQALPNPTPVQLDKEIDYFQQILDLKSDHAVAWDGLNRARAQKQALLQNQDDDARKKQQASAGAARAEQAFVAGDM